MGFFDMFRAGGGRSPTTKGDANATAAAKWAEKAGDKRAQNYDRQEAIAALAEMKTSDAAAALLRRFRFDIDPSITDQEEKQAAFDGVLNAGEDAVESIRAFAAKASSLAWPMKLLTELLEENAYVEELLTWLSRWDTEYAKFVDPKIQLLVELGDHRHDQIRGAVEPFLEDVNETARFHAVATTFAQEDTAAIPALLRTLANEESFRVKNKLADGFVSRSWLVPEDQRETTRKVLPPGYSIDATGKINKRD